MFFVDKDQKWQVGEVIDGLKGEIKRLEAMVMTLEGLPEFLPKLSGPRGMPGKADEKTTAGIGGNYAGVSAPKAAADCLQRAGKPLPIRDLIERMFAGGYVTKAKNFEANLYTVLAHRPDMFTRVSPGVWALA